MPMLSMQLCFRGKNSGVYVAFLVGFAPSPIATTSTLIVGGLIVWFVNFHENVERSVFPSPALEHNKGQTR